MNVSKTCHTYEFVLVVILLLTIGIWENFLLNSCEMVLTQWCPILEEEEKRLRSQQLQGGNEVFY